MVGVQKVWSWLWDSILIAMSLMSFDPLQDYETQYLISSEETAGV